MKFQKGHDCWNKGLTKEDDPRVAHIAKVCSEKNKGQVPWSKGKPAWNKGLTKETDERIARQSNNSKGVSHNWVPWNKGVTKESEPRLKVMSEKISKTLTGRTKETHSSVMAQSIKMTGRNKENNAACLAISVKLTGRKTGRSWSKGMTKETSPILARQSEKMKGKFAREKHPNWIDGRSFIPYGDNFRILRKQTKERDGHTCQYCGVEEVNYWRKLDVHHIDYNKQNGNEFNLITLCHLCNIYANKDREYWEFLYKSKITIKYKRGEFKW
jgi:5-methylcytosine-specific restriction endonuclease McrA